MITQSVRDKLLWIGKKIIDFLWVICLIIMTFVGLQILVFASFKIPSDSMEPELTTGDNVLVSKLIVGPRVFNVFPTLRNEQVDIYRIPGMRNVRRDDVLVFNFPHPNGWDKIEMHILKYYIKRCIGLPGDTLSIRNGKYVVSGVDSPLGNVQSQKRIGACAKKHFPDGVYQSFPYDSIIGWNIKDFGPLYIPKAGEETAMNRTTFRLYKKIIEWEQQKELAYRDSVVYLSDRPITSYCFQKNYYFMGGDNGENSQDSRYWGLLPEEYIVGKAWLVWKSVDPMTDEFRWDRFLKRIR